MGTIYLDYAATTPVDPQVIEKMVRFLGPGGGIRKSFLNRASTRGRKLTARFRSRANL